MGLSTTVDGRHGVKDLDVWAFFRAYPGRPFPYRTVWNRDFGPSHFGKHPNNAGYTGRRVDLIGRSIEATASESPVEGLHQWLAGGAASESILLAGQ